MRMNVVSNTTTENRANMAVETTLFSMLAVRRTLLSTLRWSSKVFEDKTPEQDCALRCACSRLSEEKLRSDPFSILTSSAHNSGGLTSLASHRVSAGTDSNAVTTGAHQLDMS